MPIMMGSRDLQAVRVQVDVAGQIRQGEAVKIFVGVGLPEDQQATRAAAADSHQRTITEPAQAPDDSLRDSLGDLLPDRIRFVGREIEQADNRLMHSSQKDIAPLVFRPWYEAVLKWVTGPVESTKISAAPRPEEFVLGQIATA